MNFKNTFDKGERDIIFGTQDGLVSTMGALIGIRWIKSGLEIFLVAGGLPSSAF